MGLGEMVRNADWTVLDGKYDVHVRVAQQGRMSSILYVTWKGKNGSIRIGARSLNEVWLVMKTTWAERKVVGKLRRVPLSGTWVAS